jgi:hypothetical protein
MKRLKAWFWIAVCGVLYGFTLLLDKIFESKAR